MYKFTKAEQETHIMWDAEKQEARIYTANTTKVRELDRLVSEYPEAYKCIWTDGDGMCKRYTVSAKYIRFGKPASAARRAQGARLSEARRNHSNNQEEKTCKAF